MSKAYDFFKIILTLAMLSIVPVDLYAQDVLLKGRVTDADSNEPLPGVNVIIQNTTQGTTTNFDGEFTLAVASGESIVVSYIGYTEQIVPITTQTKLDIKLSVDVEALDEVVVIGYGTQKKKEITGAVGSVKSEDILKVPTSDLGESLQGQIAGVDVQASSGRPGAEANIQIRGIVSAKSAGGPLYIVDGIPFQGNPNIAPEQIKSIDVLKDGAAASVYGTRAAGGVILITTKRGEEGKLSVDFSAYAGIQNITSNTPLNNHQEQLYVDHNRIASEGGMQNLYLFNPNAGYNDSDYVGDVQNNNAVMQSYNLGVSGGSKNLKFNVSTNYFNQDGVLINSGFERFTTRMNGEYTQGKFKAFASVGITDEKRQQEPWGLYELAIAQKPWVPSLSQNTPVGGNGLIVETEQVENFGYLATQLSNENNTDVMSTNLALALEYEIVKGLKYKASFGRNTYSSENVFFQPQLLIYREDGSLAAGASQMESRMTINQYLSNSTTFENILSYNKSFGKHNLGVTAVYSFEEYNNETRTVMTEGLLDNQTKVLSSGSVAFLPQQYLSTNTLVGKLLRAQYNYDNRYLVSLSVRNDGSSNFSKDNRYGTFYGASAGWNVSEEQFFKNSVLNNFMTGLKVRASFGEVGNQSISPYSFMPRIESGVDYTFGMGQNERLATGAVFRRYVNPDLKWETTISRNIGVDLGFFNDRLTVSYDYYNNNKEDMLLDQTIPPSFGTSVTEPAGGNATPYTSILVNAGNMTNKGHEVAIGYKHLHENGFQWGVTYTFSRNVNEVTDLNGVEGFAFRGGIPVQTRAGFQDHTTFLKEGYPAGSFFLLESQGVIKNEEQLKAYNESLPGVQAELGDMMYRDVNGDGVIDDNDRVYAGSGQAKFNMGMGINASYKNFDLFVQMYYSHGAMIYNGSNLYAYGMGRHKDMQYAWSPANPDSNIAAVRSNSEHPNTRSSSDFFLEDGTYLRFRNITLGYTLPKKLFNNKVNQLRFYVTAQNPFTITGYKGYDPEVGGDGLYMRGVDTGSYPITRRFLGGVKFNF
ncbi:SusC/RagA family TonB-linked outer membrane protein [Flammeovirga yaeyamensis]|uniref:SusC/RagA family TonB-linked outer membrane protein n=1 Tax=Flammeovirga yaeyamensis TaxID=367791 RepID=A0AAX1NC05_9BACT|nr:TonB-dependent receptor [Flammeovirga yaeyamensis]MBB3696955.1 TonB-linked SusC/RagA family outer membrane protein [Flammeovirga yaeyamensis]NMF33618.1 TonB-dependent receptor [Flammeovirga yaeyamensis]QWG05114.1 SusC/RagA family TonB-linked outer membrane protein [Flammeovirga yaeyamensis]